MQPNQEEFGLCANLYVRTRPGEETLVIGGTRQVEDDTANKAWKQVLSQRAARLMWFRLTLCLFPEKAPKVTTLVSTAPLNIANLSPTVTIHANVTCTEDDLLEITGRVGQESWVIQINNADARRLWTALDLALFPDGWEASTSQPTPRHRRRQTYQ